MYESEVSMESATKHVQVIVSLETHKQLKILAMEEGKTLQDMLRDCLEELVETTKKKEVIANG